MSIMQLYQYYMEGLVHKRNRLFVMSRKLLVRVEMFSYGGSVQLRPGSRIQQRKTMNIITFHHNNLMGVVNYQFT